MRVGNSKKIQGGKIFVVSPEFVLDHLEYLQRVKESEVMCAIMFDEAHVITEW